MLCVVSMCDSQGQL